MNLNMKFHWFAKECIFSFILYISMNSLHRINCIIQIIAFHLLFVLSCLFSYLSLIYWYSLIFIHFQSNTQNRTDFCQTVFYVFLFIDKMEYTRSLELQRALRVALIPLGNTREDVVSTVQRQLASKEYDYCIYLSL